MIVWTFCEGIRLLLWKFGIHLIALDAAGVLLSLGVSWSDTHISAPTWQRFNRWTVRNDNWNDITSAWNKIEAAAADFESGEENRCLTGGSIEQGLIESRNQWE